MDKLAQGRGSVLSIGLSEDLQYYQREYNKAIEKITEAADSLSQVVHDVNNIIGHADRATLDSNVHVEHMQKSILPKLEALEDLSIRSDKIIKAISPIINEGFYED